MICSEHVEIRSASSETDSNPEDIYPIYAVVNKQANVPKDTISEKPVTESESSVERKIKKTQILTNGSLTGSHVKYSVENIVFSVNVETVDRMYRSTRNRSRIITKCVQFEEPSENDSENYDTEMKIQDINTKPEKTTDYDSINESCLLEEETMQIKRKLNKRLVSYDSFNEAQFLDDALGSMADPEKSEANVCIIYLF